jgi:hypothetical protein
LLTNAHVAPGDSGTAAFDEAGNMVATVVGERYVSFPDGQLYTAGRLRALRFTPAQLAAAGVK